MYHLLITSKGLAFYYCDYKSPKSHELLSILGSLVKQLALQSNQSFADLETFYKDHTAQDKSLQQATTQELRDLLRLMSTRFVDVMIIIDALDEISVGRSETVELLCNLSTSGGHIKTLFTSRDEVDIRRCLSEYIQVSIAAESRDLRLYVAAEIERRIARKELWINDSELKEHIMKTLIAGADGMFVSPPCPFYHKTHSI